MAEEDTPTVMTLRGRPPRNGVIAGLNVLCIINEPTTAAIAYGSLTSAMRLDANQLAEVEVFTDKQKEVEGNCNLMIR